MPANEVTATGAGAAMHEGPIICFPFVGDTLGGSHISTVTLIRGLALEAVQPMIVVHEEGPVTAYLRDLGLGYRLLPLPRYVGRDHGLAGHLAALAASLPRLVRFLRRERIAAVHTNDGRMHLTWVLPARLTGTKLVWHQRNVFDGSRLTGLMLRLADRVIAISRFVADGLPAAARQSVVVIDNPVEAPSDLDREACRAALRRELGLPSDTPLVGLFGNLIDWKRPLLFVEAAAQLAGGREPAPAFVVFGDDRGGFRPEMEARAAARGLAGRLHFMGFRRPVWPWLAACDLLLAPAVGEPFGRTLVEAMLCGVPVVAADSGGHREILRHGETGLLVPSDDAAAMAAAASGILSDFAGRSAMVQRAREMAQERFAVASHVARVTDLYRSLLTVSRKGAHAG